MPCKHGVQNERQGHRQRKEQQDYSLPSEAHPAKVAGLSQEIRDAGSTGSPVAHENANYAERECAYQQ